MFRKNDSHKLKLIRVTGTRSDRNKGIIKWWAFVTLKLSAAVHNFYKIKNHLQFLGTWVVTLNEFYTEDHSDGMICETYDNTFLYVKE